MPRHKDQRVGIFVDVQNLYYSAKQFYHTKVNFAHILKRAIGGRELIRAIAYVIKADIKEEENFFDALEKIGYDVRSKDLQVFFGGAKKGDWDVGIAMDIMRMASKLDVVVLVSGDGDFNDLLEHVKALGCRAEVMAFRKTVSSRLLAVADEFIDLDKELGNTLIRDAHYAKREQGQDGKRSKPQFTLRNTFQQKESPSLLQIVNMDQPDLSKEKRDVLLMPPKAELPQELPKTESLQTTQEEPKIPKKGKAEKKPAKKTTRAKKIASALKGKL